MLMEKITMITVDKTVQIVAAPLRAYQTPECHPGKERRADILQRSTSWQQHDGMAVPAEDDTTFNNSSAGKETERHSRERRIENS